MIEKNLKTLRFIGRRAFFWMGIGVASSIVLAISEILVALFLQIFLIHVGAITTKVSKYLQDWSALQILILLISIGFIRFICQITSGQSLAYATEQVRLRLNFLSIYDLVYQASSDKSGISETQFKISEMSAKVAAYTTSTCQALVSGTQTLLLLAILIKVSYREALLSLVGLVIIFFVTIKINKYTKQESRKLARESKSYWSTINRIYNNLTLLKITNTVSFEENNLKDQLSKYSNMSRWVSIINSGCSAAVPFFGITLLCAITYLSLSIWHTNGLVLVSFIYLFVRFVQALSPAVTAINNRSIQKHLFEEGIKYFYSFPPEKRSFILGQIYLKQQRDVAPPQLPHGTDPVSIAFQNVSFTYEDSKESVLTNLSFSIPAGEQWGIIGPSGVGKSTLLMILCGMLHPTEGQVRVGDRKAAYDLGKYINIAYVGPEPFLIPGTLKENLSYGLNLPPSDEEILDVLKKLKLGNLSEGRHGLNYFVREDKSNLSAGQKQRLCIARAILRHPQLLILDEASANLDEATESEVVKCLQAMKHKCTIVLVTHRQGIAKYCDKIIMLNHDNQQNTIIIERGKEI